MPAPYQINQVLSTGLLRSAIFDDLIARLVAAAPPHAVVTKSIRPRRGADVFHYHRPNLERRLRADSVVTVHHDLREVEPWLDLRSFLPRYREAKVVHCLNTMQQAFLAEHGIQQVRVIPHGVDRRFLPLPDAPRRLAAGRLRLGLFSRRYARGVKGEALFEALLDHLDADRVSFLLVGEERWRDAELARAKGFAAECYERPPYRLIDALVGSIDALLILSRYEGGPASLPEALGSGVPVLATPVGMVPDFVQDGRNGLILTGDATLDGARIMALLDESDADSRYGRLADGAFHAAPAIPGWDDVMRRWLEMYSVPA
ncbi:glycosyltransferase family 4 protein [Dongia sp.]|uniref:glycosyltransferase family 4 protein n=1 Tax=Dongia sp. TaxID=1977262 RepID=UPI0037524819